MSETEEKTKDSNLKSSNDKQILIQALKNSALAQIEQNNATKEQNKATNKRIDKIDGTMVLLVDEIKILVETSIRREESEIRNTERYDRQEKILIDIVERVYIVEKQVLLLKKDYKNSKDEKEKDEKNSDTRKNTIISGLSIILIIGFLIMVAPYLGK